MLLGGVAATNALFFGIARSGGRAEMTAAGVAAAQCLFGIGWATVFLLLATGGSQLSLGMFICANLYALFQVRKRSFMVLAAIAGVCYATATATHYSVAGGTMNLKPELLNLATYLGLVAWLTFFATYLDDLRQQLHDRNAELRSHIRRWCASPSAITSPNPSTATTSWTHWPVRKAGLIGTIPRWPCAFLTWTTSRR